MGLALIIPDIDFSNSNLGRVTITGDVPVRGIYIDGPGSVDSRGAQFEALFIPQNTSERGVVWSIVSGSEYATISAAGVVAPLPGALFSPVTIKAVSTSDANVFATKDLIVTASGVFIDLGTLTWMAGERFPNGTVRPGDVWGTLTDAIDVTGHTKAYASVPAEKVNFIVEVLYFDDNDVNVGGVKYLYPDGYWGNYLIVPDNDIPVGATKMYVSTAIRNVPYAADHSDGVILTLA